MLSAAVLVLLTVLDAAIVAAVLARSAKPSSCRLAMKVSYLLAASLWASAATGQYLRTYSSDDGSDQFYLSYFERCEEGPLSP